MTRFILLFTVITTLTTCTAQKEKPESFTAQTAYETWYVKGECEGAKMAAYDWHFDARENRLTIRTKGKYCLEIEKPMVFFTKTNECSRWQLETEYGRMVFVRGKYQDTITHTAGPIKFVYFSSEPKYPLNF